jgi:hypothetical protein
VHSLPWLGSFVRVEVSNLKSSQDLPAARQLDLRGRAGGRAAEPLSSPAAVRAEDAAAVACSLLAAPAASRMEKGTVIPSCADVNAVADVESGGAPAASCDEALKQWVAQRGVDPEQLLIIIILNKIPSSLFLHVGGILYSVVQTSLPPWGSMTELP